MTVISGIICGREGLNWIEESHAPHTVSHVDRNQGIYLLIIFDILILSSASGLEQAFLPGE